MFFSYHFLLGVVSSFTIQQSLTPFSMWTALKQKLTHPHSFLIPPPSFPRIELGPFLRFCNLTSCTATSLASLEWRKRKKKTLHTLKGFALGRASSYKENNIKKSDRELEVILQHTGFSQAVQPMPACTMYHVKCCCCCWWWWWWWCLWLHTKFGECLYHSLLSLKRKRLHRYPINTAIYPVMSMDIYSVFMRPGQQEMI